MGQLGRRPPLDMGKDGALGRDRTYRRPKSFIPLVSIYVAAFYTGVIGSAQTEQLYKYWEEHPGEAVPIMRPKLYWGPWRIDRGQELPPNM